MLSDIETISDIAARQHHELRSLRGQVQDGERLQAVARRAVDSEAEQQRLQIQELRSERDQSIRAFECSARGGNGQRLSRTAGDPTVAGRGRGLSGTASDSTMLPSCGLTARAAGYPSPDSAARAEFVRAHAADRAAAPTQPSCYPAWPAPALIALMLEIEAAEQEMVAVSIFVLSYS